MDHLLSKEKLLEAGCWTLEDGKEA